MTDCLNVDPTLVLVLGLTPLEEDGDPLYVGPECYPVPVDPEEPDGQMTATGIWWSTLILPPRPLRYTYTGESRYVGGRTLLSAVQDQSSLQVTIAVQGDDLTELRARQSLVDAATLGRGVRVLDDGATYGEWPTDPSLAAWAQSGTTPQGQALRTVEGGLVLPANPQVA